MAHFITFDDKVEVKGEAISSIVNAFLSKEKEMKEKDAEMVDSAESETSKALLTKFDTAMTVDWKEWISKDSVTGWEFKTLPGPKPCPLSLS